MRKLIVITLTALIFNGSISFADQSITIASGEWPPYQSEHLEHYGFASRIVTEAFALEGITVKYGFMPWKRSYIMTERGMWDATFLWSVTDNRKQIFYISDPIVSGKDVFFHLKSFKFDWNSFKDLKGIKIGGVIGYDYGPDYQNAEKAGLISVERTKTDAINFKKLLGKRIQVFVCNIFVANALLNDMYDSETVARFTYNPKPVRVIAYHLLFSKGVPDNQKKRIKFNSGLYTLKKSGEFDRFIDKYIVVK